MAYRETIPPDHGQAYQGQQRTLPPGYHPQYYPNGSPAYPTQQHGQGYSTQSFSVYSNQPPPQASAPASYDAGFAPPPNPTVPPVQYVNPTFLQQMVSPMPAYQPTPTQSTAQITYAPATHQIQQSGQSVQSTVASPNLDTRSPSAAPHHATYKKDPRRMSNISGVARSPTMANATAHIDPLHALIYVAEDCFTKANVGAPDLAKSMSDEEVNEHHKLVSTGLRCLEVALQLKKLSPRQEARIRLRYAGVLVDETTNTMAAETALTENLALCQKHLFVDMRYCSQFLLLKVLFQRNPKSAFKAIEKHISNCETYQHYPWAYAFRFLKAAMFLQSANPTDHEALENLRKIAEISERRQDKAIYVMASLLEGLAHLSTGKDDSIIKIQTCIAQASKLQLEESTQIPQVNILLLLLDFACSLQPKGQQTPRQKLEALQQTIDELKLSTQWTKDNEILLPVKKHSQASQPLVSGDTRAVLRQGPGETDFLVLTGLGRAAYYAIAHIFHGVYATHRSTMPGRNVTLWTETVKLLEENRSMPQARSLPETIKYNEWAVGLIGYARVLMGLSHATSTEWVRVKGCIDDIKHAGSPAGILDTLTLYLSGVFYQGVGNLDAALEIWSDDRFRLEPAHLTLNRISHIERQLSTLATLNRVWALCDTRYRDNAIVGELLDHLRLFCDESADVDTRMAYDLVTASIQPRTSVMKIKAHLQKALTAAQHTGNSHILSIALNLMRDRIFNGVVGEQALKSARAALAQAKKSGNLLWISTAQDMLAESIEKQGHERSDVRIARDLGKRLADDLWERTAAATQQ